MSSVQEQEALDTLDKLDRLWENDIDYLEHLFGMIQEGNPNSPEWKSLLIEFENTVCNYDMWMENRHINWRGKW